MAFQDLTRSWPAIGEHGVWQWSLFGVGSSGMATEVEKTTWET